jgi:hypothetical protein
VETECLPIFVVEFGWIGIGVVGCFAIEDLVETAEVAAVVIAPEMVVVASLLKLLLCSQRKLL